jgi:hypothetical protein
VSPGTAAPGVPVRTDAELRGVDVTAALGRGLVDAPDGPDRQRLFTSAAIAAALAAEDLHVGPYPLGFLARYVRTAGLAMALKLPEPLIRPEQAELVRDWMRAAESAAPGSRRDDVFARWLDMVAALLTARRKARLASIRLRFSR